LYLQSLYFSKVLFSTTQSKSKQNWFVLQLILFLNRALLCYVHSLFSVIYANMSFDNVLKTPSTISLGSICFAVLPFFLYYILWLFFFLFMWKETKLKNLWALERDSQFEEDLREPHSHYFSFFFSLKLKPFRFTVITNLFLSSHFEGIFEKNH
jgi:hypothetical protein